MLKVRLQRVGRRNDPAFRAIVTQSTRAAKSGRNLEIVGSHHPGQDKTELNGERIMYWIGKGAQVSDTLYNLLIKKGVLSGKKRDSLPRKNSFKKVDPPAGQAGAAAEAGPAPVAEATAPTATPSAEEEPAETPAPEAKG